MLLTYSEIYTEIYSEIYSEIKTRSYFSLPSAYHKTTPAPNTLADFKTPETLKRQTYIYNCFRDFCIFDFHASFFALPRKSHESNNTKVPSKLQRERQQALQRKTYPNHILPTARAQQALQHQPYQNHIQPTARAQLALQHKTYLNHTTAQRETAIALGTLSMVFPSPRVRLNPALAPYLPEKRRRLNSPGTTSVPRHGFIVTFRWAL